MFAPEIERRPWAEIREWFAAAGVALPEEAGMYAFGAGELGQALGEPGAQYDCTRLVQIADACAAVGSYVVRGTKVARESATHR